MKREFDFEPKDGVGVRVYRAESYALLRIRKTGIQEGSSYFLLQSVLPKGGDFVVPADIVENGGFCEGPEEGTVWQFPSRERYSSFTNLAGRGERKIKRLLTKFDPRRLLRRYDIIA